MNTKNLLALFALTFSMTSVAFAAADPIYGIEVGIRQQSGDVSTTGFEASSQSGFQFGATAAFPIQEKLSFRTGMLYTQRPILVKQTLGATETKVTLNYLDVPVTAMYRFEDYAGAFVGINLSMNIDKSTDNSNFAVTGVKSMLTPLVFGVTFKFAPQLGASLYFETGGGEPATGLASYRAVGANLLVTFD